MGRKAGGADDGRHAAPRIEEDVAMAERQVGRYRLLERVGAGGMGEVYLAELVGVAGFRRRCAVKLVLPHRVARDDVVAMFEREAVLAARIAHENVVQVFDFGRDGDALYLVMEYVDGLTLRALAERRWKKQPLSVPEVCSFIADAARGLQAIHALKERVVHRDVTPDNILVTREGVAKIGDFGIAMAADMARLTTTGELKGKIPYMAPEQLDGGDITSAADVFSLGVTLHTLLSGKRPFDRGTELGTMNAIVNEAPPRLRDLRGDVPAAVEDLSRRMLAKVSFERPTAAEVADVLAFAGDRPKDLVTLVLGPPTRALAPPLETQVVEVLHSTTAENEPATELVTAETSAGFNRRRRRRAPPAAVVAAASLVLVLVAAAGAWVWAARGGPEPPVALGAVAQGAVGEGAVGEGAVGEGAGAARDAGVLVVVEDAAAATVADAPDEPEARPGRRHVVVPEVSLVGPPSVSWSTLDGKKLGVGELHVRLRSHAVAAFDGATGARCMVPIASGVARFDALPTGAVDVRANPYAAVSVGGRALGTTPISPPPELKACSYRMRFVYEKKTRTETVRVVAGKTTPVRVDMDGSR